MTARTLALLGVVCGLGLAGCGSSSSGGSGGSATTQAGSTPTASIPLAPPPPTDATTTTPTSKSKAQTAAPESQPGGAGDEQSIRVPATLLAGRGQLEPRSVSVPAFLAVQVTIVSGDSRPHVYDIETPTTHRLTVPAGGHAGVRIPGLKAGRYRIAPVMGGGPGATLVVGGEPGP